MEKLAKNLTNLIQRNNSNLTDIQIKTIQFGLHCMLGETSKFLIYLIIFSVFSSTGYFITGCFFFCALRIIAGGYHAETYLKCFFTSLFIFIAIITTATYIYLSTYAKLLILLIAFIITGFYAPVDHPNKPIISPLRRKKFKYLSLFMVVFLGLIGFLLPGQYSSIAILAILIEVITLPIGQLAKRRYRNEPVEG